MARKPIKIAGASARAAVMAYKPERPDTEAPASGLWYALVCNVNQERKVRDVLEPSERRRRELEELGRPVIQTPFRAYLPCFAIVQKVGGRRKTVAVIERPVFPRYLFVAHREDAPFPFWMLAGLKGVESFVRCEGRPLTIPHAIIKGIMLRDLAGAFDKRDEAAKRGLIKVAELSEVGLEPGARVRATVGALEGIEGVVERLVSGAKARAIMQIFGRPTPVDIPLHELEKVA